MRESTTRAAQRLQILQWLQQHGSITTLEARAIYIMSPAPRIFELRDHGYNIVTERITKSRIARYVLFSGGDVDESHR
jgi:hypothetical protein